MRVGDLDLDGVSYNGLYAGPVLRVRPGDRLRIELVNHLSQPTNLHFHGIRASPTGTGDNVHLSVAPGGRLTYDIVIPPSQPPGLYWYHAHPHGVSQQQVMGGLSGALVVEGPDTGIAERLFVLKEISFDDDTGDDRIDDELHGLVQSVNGALQTAQTLRPGETQLWRFTNQSADRPFHIALQGHRLRIVARDGEAIVGTHSEDVLDIMPASRVDVLIQAGAPGRYTLLSKGVMTGTGTNRKPDRVLGTLTVAGDPVDAEPAWSAAPAPPDLRQAHIDAERSVVFTQTTTLKASEQRFFVNGRLFDADRVDLRVPLGNIEEWTIRNDSDDLHVFHIHQLGFQVVAVNGEKLPFTGVVDTVRVPERGEVKIRLAFTDRRILGQFMFHCHVLKHEDRGMMAQIEVYDPAPSVLLARANKLYLHVWWWLHGVPWELCGVGSA